MKYFLPAIPRTLVSSLWMLHFFCVVKKEGFLFFISAYSNFHYRSPSRLKKKLYIYICNGFLDEKDRLVHSAMYFVSTYRYLIPSLFRHL